VNPLVDRRLVVTEPVYRTRLERFWHDRLDTHHPMLWALDVGA
jgi:hypothetical protein